MNETTYQDHYHRLGFQQKPNGVLLITIGNRGKANAADGAMHSELSRVWSDIDRDPSVRVAVITGAGHMFSAGGDFALMEQLAGNHSMITEMLDEMGRLVHNMIDCRKPIISAINGAAVGSGLVVALMADISVCAQDAKLGDGHVKLGIAAGDHSAILWPLLIGMAKARYYLLTGELLTGAEAERLGMVSIAVPRPDVLDEAVRIADGLGRGSQTAIRWTKRALTNWLRTASPILDQSAAYEMLGFLGPDFLEGVMALKEKRDPQFPSVR